jgi:hypothetical protein
MPPEEERMNAPPRGDVRFFTCAIASSSLSSLLTIFPSNFTFDSSDVVVVIVVSPLSCCSQISFLPSSVSSLPPRGEEIIVHGITVVTDDDDDDDKVLREDRMPRKNKAVLYSLL